MPPALVGQRVPAAVTALEWIPEGLQIYVLPSLMVLLGALLFQFAPKLLGPVAGPERKALQTTILRAVIVIFIGFQIADLALHQALEGNYGRTLVRASGTLAMIYLMLVAFNLLAQWLDRKFGRSKSIDGKVVSMASYHSRMATLILVVVMSILVIYGIITIWQMDGLTARTGFVGVVAAFFILTNMVWFPDIYFGLTLLGSSMADEGDTVRLKDEDRLFIINRLTPIYAFLLNVDTNERVILRNSNLLDGALENLTKRAGIEGLRRHFELNLTYPATERDSESRAALFARLDKAVDATTARLADIPDLQINQNVPLTWLLTATGNDALQFSVYFHMAPLPETKLTKKIRDHMRRSPAILLRVLYEECADRGLHLATPRLFQLTPLSQETEHPPH